MESSASWPLVARSESESRDGHTAPRAGRDICLLVIVVVCLVATAGAASGAAEPRDRLGGVDAPAVVYQGEQLDVTDVTQTGSGQPIGTGPVDFRLLTGDAERVVEASDAGRVDFAAVPTGAYDTNGDMRADVVVREPVVSDVTVETASGASLAGGSVPASTSITVAARFNFAAADRVEIGVTGPDGRDVGRAVLGAGSATHVTEAGGSVRADFTGQPAGTYRITATGSQLDATREVTLTVHSEEPTIALDRARVAKGERAGATVLGTPGERRHVRIPAAALDGVEPTDAGARQVFDGTGQVVDHRGNESGGVVAAVVRLDDDGEGRVVVRSHALRAETTVPIEPGRAADPTADPGASANLRIEPAGVAMTGYPATVASASTFEVSGRAPAGARLKAYGLVGGAWHPLYSDGRDLAHGTAGEDGRFTMQVDGDREIRSPGVYRLAIAIEDRDRFNTDQVVSPDEFRRLTADDAVVRVTRAGQRARLSRAVLAAGTDDEVTVTAETERPEATVHVYAVHPDGGLQVAESVQASSGTVERDYDAFPGTGEYRFVVVTADDHDGLESSPTVVRSRLSGRESADETLTTVREAYNQNDAAITELRLRVDSPTVAVTDHPQAAAFDQGPVQVSGTTNRQPATTVDVDIRRDGAVAASDQATVDADGTWRVELDLADAPDGRYLLVASTAGTTDYREFVLGDGEPSTATPTPTTETATETAGGSGPGFGIASALGAVALALATGVGRRR